MDLIDLVHPLHLAPVAPVAPSALAGSMQEARERRFEVQDTNAHPWSVETLEKEEKHHTRYMYKNTPLFASQSKAQVHQVKKNFSEKVWGYLQDQTASESVRFSPV